VVTLRSRKTIVREGVHVLDVSPFQIVALDVGRDLVPLPFNGGTLSLFLIAKSDVREGFLHFPS